MPTYYSDEDNNDYDNYDDGGGYEESADDWEGDWDSDFNQDYDWGDEEQDYSDDSNDDYQDDFSDSDWEDMFGDYDYSNDFGDDGGSSWEDMMGGFTDPGEFPGYDDSFWDSTGWNVDDWGDETNIVNDMNQFDAETGDLLDTPAGPEDWSVFETPEAQQWLEDFAALNPLATAEEIANSAAAAFMEAVDASNAPPELLLEEQAPPDFNFDETALPNFIDNNSSEAPAAFDDMDAMMWVANIAAQMPEFEGMSVEEIADKLQNNPEMMQNIIGDTSSGEAIDRQTGDPIEDPNNPQAQDELSQMAFGDSEDLVNPQIANVPEAIMNGDENAISDLVDNAVSDLTAPATTDESAPTPENASVLMPPEEVPFARYMPMNVENADGSTQQEVVGASGDTYIYHSDGSMAVRDADTGEERALYGEEDAQWRGVFEGTTPDTSDTVINAKGMNISLEDALQEGGAQLQLAGDNPDVTDRVLLDPVTHEPITFDSSAQASAALSQVAADIRDLEIKLKAAGDAGDWQAGGEIRQQIEDKLKFQNSLRGEMNTILTREAAARTNGRATGKITFEDAGGTTEYDPATGKTKQTLNNRAGWIVTQDEEGNRNGIIQNIYMTPGGSLYTTTQSVDESGKKMTNFFGIELGPKDVYMQSTPRGVERVNIFESGSETTERIKREDADTAFSRNQQAADAAAARREAAASAARSAGGSRSSGGASGGASKSAELQKESADAALAQRVIEHADDLAFQYAKMSQDSDQFLMNLDMVQSQLDAKIQDSMAQRDQFAQTNDLNKQEFAERQIEFASNLQNELAKIQQNADQFMMNYQTNRDQLAEVMRSNLSKEEQSKEELALAREKFALDKDKPDIVNLGGGQYLQFNPETGEWETKGGGGFSGSRNRGGYL